MPATKRLTRHVSHTDAILPMNDPYMGQIIDGSKNYEFRKYLLKPTIRRIWFYRTAPISSITHVCEILPARTRNPGDTPLEEDGLGNREYNTRHKDWEGYDYAYKIVSVYELTKPVHISAMRSTYSFKSAPRSLVYLPGALGKDIVWNRQKKILDRRPKEQGQDRAASPPLDGRLTQTKPSVESGS